MSRYSSIIGTNSNNNNNNNSDSNSNNNNNAVVDWDVIAETKGFKQFVDETLELQKVQII